MIVYRLISPSGKSYIGITTRSFKSRFTSHISTWKTNKRDCTKLCYAFDKYPPNTWSHEILFNTQNQLEAEQKEIEFIQQFDSINNGYNVLLGGKISRLGIRHSEETKQKISQIQKGRTQTEEAKQKNRLTHLGKKHGPMSLENRLKLSLAHIGKPSPKRGIPMPEAQRRFLSLINTGKKFTEEHKKKIALAGLGKKHTEESKQKLRESKKGILNPMFGKPAWNRGIPLKDETKRKLRLANLGKKHPHIGYKRSEETKKKISVANIGKKLTKDHKVKLSESVKLAWIRRKAQAKEAALTS